MSKPPTRPPSTPPTYVSKISQLLRQQITNGQELSDRLNDSAAFLNHKTQHMLNLAHVANAIGVKRIMDRLDGIDYRSASLHKLYNYSDEHNDNGFSASDYVQMFHYDIGPTLLHFETGACDYTSDTYRLIEAYLIAQRDALKP